MAAQTAMNTAIARAGSVGREQPRRDQRRRAAGDDRGELIADRGAAVAEPRREPLGDERRLRAVHQVVRQQRQRDGEEDERRHARVQQPEIDEAVDAGHHRAQHVDALAAEAVRQAPGERDRKRDDRRGEQRAQQEVARQVQRACRRRRRTRLDVERRLLRHAANAVSMICGLTPDHLEHRRALDSFLGDQPPNTGVSRMPMRM